MLYKAITIDEGGILIYFCWDVTYSCPRLSSDSYPANETFAGFLRL